MEQDDPMMRWRAEGYLPELVRNAQGQWTVEFGQGGSPVPEWADWTGGPAWQATEQEAIKAAAKDEQLAAAHRRAEDRRKERAIDNQELEEFVDELVSIVIENCNHVSSMILLRGRIQHALLRRLHLSDPPARPSYWLRGPRDG